jgi:phosphoglycerate dehydrogenase-like enzyme
MSASVVGVVGTGFIGSKIAPSIAATGKQAIHYEPTAEALQRSRAGLREARALEHSCGASAA